MLRYGGSLRGRGRETSPPLFCALEGAEWRGSCQNSVTSVVPTVPSFLCRHWLIENSEGQEEEGVPCSLPYPYHSAGCFRNTPILY